MKHVWKSASCLPSRRILDPEVAFVRTGVALSSSCGALQAGLDAVAAGALGGVHSFFGISCRLSRRNAQAQRNLHVRTSSHDAAGGDVRTHAFGKFPCFSEAAARSDDQELFSAVTPNRVVGPYHGRNAAGNDA